jgi:urease accessory protein
MLQLTRIVGLVTDPTVADRLHELDHAGGVEQIVLGRQDMQRHRLRAVTDRGTECAIALSRAESLANGAVLLLEDDRAIVVRMAEQAWLMLQPRDAAAALELGYFAGNMHWRVRFEGAQLAIALEGPAQSYLDRLAHLIADGRVSRTDAG